MKISEMIKNLKYQLDTYGDAEVRIDWSRHEQTTEKQIFFSRVIGNKELSEGEEAPKETTSEDGLWLQNYPY